MVLDSLNIIDYETYCAADHLSIYDGTDQLSSRMAVICGVSLGTETFISSENSLFLRFVTDGSGTSSGFAIHLTIIADTVSSVDPRSYGIISNVTTGSANISIEETTTIATINDTDSNETYAEHNATTVGYEESTDALAEGLNTTMTVENNETSSHTNDTTAAYNETYMTTVAAPETTEIITCKYGTHFHNIIFQRLLFRDFVYVVL